MLQLFSQCRIWVHLIGIRSKPPGCLCLVVAVWLANQVAGFAVHHTLDWGIGLGAVAIVSTLAALWIKDQLAQSHMGRDRRASSGLRGL
jgi:hypothetical protein